MKWHNLKRNKCPDCNIDWLKLGNATFSKGLIVCKCGFKITEKRMADIIADMVNRDIDFDYSEDHLIGEVTDQHKQEVQDMEDFDLAPTTDGEGHYQ